MLGEICLTRPPVTELAMECEQVHSEFWQIPQPKYLANDFSADLAEVSYSGIQVKSVGAQVFKPFAQYMAAKMDVLEEMIGGRRTDAESEQFQYLMRTQQNHRGPRHGPAGSRCCCSADAVRGPCAAAESPCAAGETGCDGTAVLVSGGQDEHLFGKTSPL